MDNSSSSSKPKWNFPDNNYGRAQGFGTSDLETFQKDPVAYFAREICQNSIDAHIENSSEPVRVDFKIFKIRRDQIPGFSNLYEEVKHCQDYAKRIGKEEYVEAAQKIYKSFGDDYNPYIMCLRVSDFNTTGLYGVEENRPELPFFDLTRGSGSSYKSDTSAGSKGIGKYASFVVSNAKTVFYSTRACNPNTKKTEIGHIGVSKLCARPLNDKGLFTQGDGYYAIKDYNYPVQSELHLDPDFHRGGADFGTDVFIIGFKDDESWRRDIIRKILESFMVAIIYGALVVNVDNIRIDKDTVGGIVDEYRRGSSLNKEDVLIISQYDLLTLEGDSVHKKTVSIDGCNVHLFVRTYNPDDGWKWASKQCIAVRYPYMKITKLNTYSLADFSAMCIIDNNDLNKKLRRIENPQHVAWEKNRLKDKPEKYKEINTILRALNRSINNYIEEILKTNSSDTTDFEGAGEYLPDSEIEDLSNTDFSSQDEPLNDKPIVSTPTRRKTRSYSKKANESGDDAEQSGTGRIEDDGNEGSEDMRATNNNTNGSSPDSKPHEDSPEHNYKDGDKQYMKHLINDHTRIRCIMPTNNAGTYDLVFTATEDCEKCKVNIFAVGDSNDKEHIAIMSATLNGENCDVEDGAIVNMKINQGEKYKICCKINRSEIFASKVEIYACQ